MIYLDNAATSFPKPPGVYTALERCMRDLGANPGRAGYRMAMETARMLAETRRALAHLIGASSPDRIVFTLNATDSLNMAIKGALFPRKENAKSLGHVVTSVLEHNSVTRPLNRLEYTGQIRVTKIAPNAEGLFTAQQVLDSLQDDTRLVVLTHCSNVLGTIEPIGEIGAAIANHPALFLVDAAQTVGSAPIDIATMQIDLLAFPGHKGLMGPPGTGGLYVREGVDLDFWREGGTGDDSAALLHPESMPYRLEAGTPNTIGIGGLAEAIRFIQGTGPQNILRHEQALIDHVLNAASSLPNVMFYGPKEASYRAGVLAFNILGMEPHEVATILEESFGIAVRAGLHCAPDAHRFLGTYPHGAVRVSPGWFNTIDEMGVLVSALREISDQ